MLNSESIDSEGGEAIVPGSARTSGSFLHLSLRSNGLIFVKATISS